MLITHDELVMILEQKYPNAKSNKDYYVAMPIELDSGNQTGKAFIAEWNVPNEETPTEEQIDDWIEEFTVRILTTRALYERLAQYQPISSRQLWLMGRKIGITKSAVIAAINANEDLDEEQKDILLIEISEPPINGFVRDSPAVESLREMMGIPFDQFDEYWLEAQKL